MKSLNIIIIISAKDKINKSAEITKIVRLEMRSKKRISAGIRYSITTKTPVVNKKLVGMLVY